MADPKYSKLPGIAHDQPDTYETDDLPEADQYIDFTEDDVSPFIERPNISVEAAFDRFRLKTIGGYEVNFENNVGYKCGVGVETTAQKLIRLKSELESLSQELKSKPSATDEDQQQRKELIELEEQFGHLIKSNHVDSSVLKARLEGLKESEKSASGQNLVQYELMVEKKLSRSSAGAKATELEARINRLENVLGGNDGKEIMIPLELRPKNKTVLGALTVLHSKLSLLEPSHIELLEGKITSVLDKVNKIAEKKLDVQELERTLKLSNLYELLESSSSTIEALPEISIRLKALRELHSKAADVVRELGELKVVQEAVAAGTMENDLLLNELKTILETVMIIK